MRALIPIVLMLIVLLAVFAYVAFTAMQADRVEKGKRPDRSKPWDVVLEDRNTVTEAWLTKGKYREFFGSTSLQADDYSDKLIELELAAEERASERNNARRVLGK